MSRQLPKPSARLDTLQRAVSRLGTETRAYKAHVSFKGGRVVF